MTKMTGTQFLQHLADQLLSELAYNSKITTFVKNPDVIGAYAEASVRQFVCQIVSPLRVSTGAVIDEKLCSEPGTVPQLDTIIWSPSPAPAIFRSGDFGLVPRSSSFGVMEIKRSAYNRDVAKKMKKFLSHAFDLVSDVAEEQVKEYRRAGADPLSMPHPGIGVICLQMKRQSISTLEDEIKGGKVVVLMKQNDNGEYEADPKAIHRLVNFLILTRARAKHMDGCDLVNVGLL